MYLASINETNSSRQLALLSITMPDEKVLRRADGLWLSEMTEGVTMAPEER